MLGHGAIGQFAVGQVRSSIVNAHAASTVFTLDLSILPGHAVGSAVAHGEELVLSAIVLDGTALGTAHADGSDQILALSVDAGHATGTSDGIGDGTLVAIGLDVIAGIASAEQQPGRITSGLPFIGPRRGDALAPGADITVGIEIIPGDARIGHVLTVHESDGTVRVITLYGLTDEELRSDELVLGLIEGDPLMFLSKKKDAA